MTALSELFPDGPRASGSGGAVLDDHHTARRLREMIGDPRENVVARPAADTRVLAEMVESAARTALPVSTGPTAFEGARKRPPRSFDALTASSVALAVVAVVVAATVGGIQTATASPASSAMDSLEADEAAVQNAYQSLKTAHDRLLADVETQTADAALLRSALTETSTVVDPAGEPGEDVLAVSDPAALSAAIAAIDSYVAGLAAIIIPELPAQYERGPVDEESLVAVGGAIDEVHEGLVVLDEASAQARGLRTQLEALRPPAVSAATAYATSFVPAAAAASGRYPDADPELQTALTAAAARIASVDLWSAVGRAALVAYRDAFAALAADQLRVEIERAQEEESNQWQWRGDDSQTPPEESTEPPPTTPVEPTEPITPTEPVEPDTPPVEGVNP